MCVLSRQTKRRACSLPSFSTITRKEAARVRSKRAKLAGRWCLVHKKERRDDKSTLPVMRCTVMGWEMIVDVLVVPQEPDITLVPFEPCLSQDPQIFRFLVAKGTVAYSFLSFGHVFRVY